MEPTPQRQISKRLDTTKLAELQALGGGRRPDLLRKLVHTFNTDTIGRLSELRRNSEAGDLDGVAVVAHSMKGSAAWVGAERLATLCAELEAQAHSGMLSEAEALISAIDEEFALTLPELTACAEEFASGQPR